MRDPAGVVFVPFHYGYWDRGDSGPGDGVPRAANELTATGWDPVSKQPYYKVAAVRVSKAADALGVLSAAPTTGAASPHDPRVPVTAGGPEAEAREWTEADEHTEWAGSGAGEYSGTAGTGDRPRDRSGSPEKFETSRWFEED
nr:hypothetical protein GCM10020093_029170 [Planobispora longispora]